MKPFITQAVDDIVRGPLSTALKPLGFRRKGQRFWRSAGPFVQLVEIDRYKYNQALLGGLRASAGIFSPDVWALWTEARPELATLFSATDPPIQNCLAELVLDAPPQTSEIPLGYWPVSPETDLVQTGVAFTQSIRSDALPWLDAHSTWPALMARLRQRSERGDWHASAMLFFSACVAGAPDEAAVALARVLERKVHNPSFPASERNALLSIAARFGIARSAPVAR